MKIFDATAVIAFLVEMKCADSLEALSKHYEIIIPEGVAGEITKSPGKEILQSLAKNKVVKIVEADQQRTNQIMNGHPQLHQGECEAIAYVQTYRGEKKVCIVSDDSKARKIFQKLNFKWTQRLLDIMKEKEIIDSEKYESKINLLQNSPFYYKGRKQ